MRTLMIDRYHHLLQLGNGVDAGRASAGNSGIEPGEGRDAGDLLFLDALRRHRYDGKAEDRQHSGHAKDV
jgi:hypothetical protein